MLYLFYTVLQWKQHCLLDMAFPAQRIIYYHPLKYDFIFFFNFSFSRTLHPVVPTCVTADCATSYSRVASAT